MTALIVITSLFGLLALAQWRGWAADSRAGSLEQPYTRWRERTQ